MDTNAVGETQDSTARKYNEDDSTQSMRKKRCGVRPNIKRRNRRGYHGDQKRQFFGGELEDEFRVYKREHRRQTTGKCHLVTEARTCSSPKYDLPSVRTPNQTNTQLLFRANSCYAGDFFLAMI
jgi:hypothetical protein